MAERSTVKEVIREVTVRARPHDETDRLAMLAFTNMRNQLATQHLTSPDVADSPLSDATLRIIQATLERFQGHTAMHVNAALQHLNTLEVAQPPLGTVQRLHSSSRTAFQRIMTWYRGPTHEQVVGEEPSFVPSTLD